MSRGRIWTPAEDSALLAGIAGGTPAAELARQLDRPETSIWSRRALLGQRSPAKIAAARAIRAAVRQGRDPAPPPPPPPSARSAALRRCLGCGKDFPSAHAGNRLCSRCREKSAGSYAYAL